MLKATKIVKVLLLMACFLETGAAKGFSLTLLPHQTTQFSQTFGANKGPMPEELIHTSDGGYAFIGTANANAEPGKTSPLLSFWLVKTDSGGNLEWQRTFEPLSRGDHFAYGLTEAKDGGFLVVGSADDDATANAQLGATSSSSSIRKARVGLVVKYDRRGNFQWKKILGPAQPHSLSDILRVMRVEDGYLLAGFTSVELTDQPTPSGRSLALPLLLVKINERGDIVWQKIYDPQWQLRGGHAMSKIVPTGDSGFVLAVSRIPSEEKDFVSFDVTGLHDRVSLFKFDKKGAVVSQSQFEAPSGLRALAVTPTGYFLAGNHEHPWFIQVDRGFHERVNKMLTNEELNISSILPSADGGVFVFGSSSLKWTANAMFAHISPTGAVEERNEFGRFYFKDAVFGNTEHELVMLWSQANAGVILIKVKH